MNKKVVDMTIEELSEVLEMAYWEQGIETLKITEDFANEPHTYVVNHLTMECNGNIVCCMCENLVKNGITVLMMFLKKCVVAIHKVITSQRVYGELEFDDGKIIIERC